MVIQYQKRSLRRGILIRFSKRWGNKTMKQEKHRVLIFNKKEVINALKITEKVLLMRLDKTNLEFVTLIPNKTGLIPASKEKRPMTNNDFFLMGVMILIFAGLILSVFILNFFYFGVSLFALLVAIFLHSRDSD